MCLVYGKEGKGLASVWVVSADDEDGTQRISRALPG